MSFFPFLRHARSFHFSFVHSIVDQDDVPNNAVGLLARAALFDVKFNLVENRLWVHYLIGILHLKENCISTLFNEDKKKKKNPDKFFKYFRIQR